MLIKTYEAKLGRNILIFKIYTIYIPSKHIYIQSIKVINFLNIYKFFKHILAFIKHILVHQTDNNCFLNKY